MARPFVCHFNLIFPYKLDRNISIQAGQDRNISIQVGQEYFHTSWTGIFPYKLDRNISIQVGQEIRVYYSSVALFIYVTETNINMFTKLLIYSFITIF